LAACPGGPPESRAFETGYLADLFAILATLRSYNMLKVHYLQHNRPRRY
jgi:hypothetical protein